MCYRFYFSRSFNTSQYSNPTSRDYTQKKQYWRFTLMFWKHWIPFSVNTSAKRHVWQTAKRRDVCANHIEQAASRSLNRSEKHLFSSTSQTNHHELTWSTVIPGIPLIRNVPWTCCGPIRWLRGQTSVWHSLELKRRHQKVFLGSFHRLNFVVTCWREGGCRK